MDNQSTLNTTPPLNFRVILYGVQGSGSIFPALADREAYRELSEYHLLEKVFGELAKHADGSGRIQTTVERILGGPLDRRTLLAFRARLAPEEPRSYGGWTTCARVETADGVDIVFDCGSGFRNCATDLQAKWIARTSREVHIFGSHSHLDHTEGFDQAALCFDPRNTLHIYGNRQFLRGLDTNLGIFSRRVSEEVRGVQTPIFYAIMPAKFIAHEIRHADLPPAGGEELAQHVHPLGEAITLGETSIRPFAVYHPAPCLAYRVERRGKVFVFCTDHELRRGSDANHPSQKASLEAERRVIEHSYDADLLYRDGQYLRAEYDGIQGIGASGPVPRIDWGHSCIEDITEMARSADVKHTLIGHHDPNRDWSERNWLDGTLSRTSQESPNRIELARAETVFEL